MSIYRLWNYLRRMSRAAMVFAFAVSICAYAMPATVFAQGADAAGAALPGPAPDPAGAEGSLAPASDENAEGEDLILAVSYPPYLLSEGLLAVQRGDDTYLPFTETAELFDFVLDTQPEQGLYRGYFKEEANSFGIDIANNQFESAGEKKALPEGAVIPDPFGGGSGEIYVRLDVLNQMWPVKLSVNMSGLFVLVETQEKLPFELRLEREEKRKLAEARKARIPVASAEQLPFKANPYRLIGPPVLDFDSSFKWDHEAKKLDGTATVSGLQDLAFATADYATTLNYEEGGVKRPESVRLRLTRQSVGDDTLALGVRKVEAGDVRVQHRDLIGTGSGGRGFTASSYPPQRSGEFDRITVEGTGIAGWEVELYINDALESFSTVDELGEYRFEDVPLTVGNNQVRIVLYGPQGQVQERIENYQISGGMARPGETNFTVGMVDSDRQLIRLVPRNSTGNEGIASNAYVSHGLNKEVTVFGSTSRLPTQEGERKYVTAGVMGSFLNSLGQAELYKELNGGQAVDLRLVTKLLGLRLNLQSAFFNNFESPDAGFGDGAKKFESEVRANTGFKTPFGNLGLQLNARHRQNVVGLPTTDVSFQQSLGLSGVNLTQETSSNFLDFNHVSSAGKLSATVRLRQWQIRTQLDYNIHPKREFSGVNGEVRYTDEDGFSAAVNAQHNFLTRGQGLGAQLGYDFGKFLGSVDVGWVKEQGVEVTLRASTSLGPYGRNGRYVMSSQKMSRSAPVQGHVFLDHNGDEVYSEGDEPIPEAHLMVGGRGTPEESDEEGYVIANAGGEGQVVNVEINKSTLADPYYLPSLPGYSTVLRPGSMPKFDLPVIETGAIDGTVYRDNGEPIPGMRLELVDEGGAVIKTTDTAYDGFYTFEFVPPGTYMVRADPSYGVNVPPETVTVASDDLFTSGIDLQLLEQVEEAEAVEGVEEGDEPSAAPDAAAESGRVAHTYHERSNGTLQPAPLSTEGDLSAFVKRVRIGEHPDTVRLVLDLSGPVVYRMGFADGGKTLNLDLPGVAWDAIPRWRGDATPVIESFETEALPEGGTRLVIRGKGSLASGLNGVLEPQNGQGYRLFLDLMNP
jgi:hypothetical protein